MEFEDDHRISSVIMVVQSFLGVCVCACMCMLSKMI